MVIGAVFFDLNNVRIGPSMSVIYSGNVDASFIYADSQNVSTTTEAGYSIVGNHYVTGFLTNSTVAKEGEATGRTTGKITSTSYTIRVPGRTVKDVVLADYSSSGGDSGGIVYQTVNGDHVPAGTHCGTYSDSSYFCKVQNIIDRLGVTPY